DVFAPRGAVYVGDSPLREFGRSRHLRGFDVPFEPLRHAKSALDGQMIDLMLTAVAGAMGRWHHRQGFTDATEVLTLVPINLRPWSEQGLDAIQERVVRLAATTRTMLADLPGVRVLDRGASLCGIVTAWRPDWQPQALLQHLAAQRINGRITTIGSAQLDFSRKGVGWALRISPHYYNTEAEIAALGEALSLL
ncbi:MAG TPA: hypothetical protein PLW66_06865, partial [Saprospiraceae bacterium]|nr:hypothetical protein [Saprospiraceae bacterium]